MYACGYHHATMSKVALTDGISVRVWVPHTELDMLHDHYRYLRTRVGTTTRSDTDDFDESVSPFLCTRVGTTLRNH